MAAGRHWHLNMNALVVSPICLENNGGHWPQARGPTDVGRGVLTMLGVAYNEELGGRERAMAWRWGERRVEIHFHNVIIRSDYWCFFLQLGEWVENSLF